VTNRERLRILRATEEFAGVTTAELEDLLPFVDELSVPAGLRLAREGSFCHELLIVAEGCLGTNGQNGCAMLGPGEAFGWNAMRIRGRNEATVIAASPTHLLVMGHQQFRAVEALTRGA